MRGLERPSKVQWTHPFLPPLKGLNHEAARKTFIDIADDNHEGWQIDMLLGLTDNIPLAIVVVASLVDFEGCPQVISRATLNSTRWNIR